MKRFGRMVLVILADVLVLFLAWFFAIILSGKDFYAFFLNEWWLFLIAIGVTVGLNAVFKLYGELLRFITFNDLIKLLFSGTLNCFYFIIVSIITPNLSLEWAIICCVFYVFALCVVRISFRFLLYIRNYAKKHAEMQKSKKVIIIGAGSGGAVLINEILNSQNLNLNPVCILDDDKKKIGGYINGIKIEGQICEVGDMVKKYGAEEIFVAMPSVKGKKLKDI